jgi:hypothetical protein
MSFVYSAAVNVFCHTAAANVFCLFCQSINPSSNSFCLFCWSMEFSVKRTVSRDPYSNGFWFIRYAILGPTANAFTYILPVQVTRPNLLRFSPSTEDTIFCHCSCLQPIYLWFGPICQCWAHLPVCSTEPLCQSDRLDPS